VLLIYYWQNLTPDEVDELHADIQNYLSLEQSDANIDFWTVSTFDFDYMSVIQIYSTEHDGCVQRSHGPHQGG
jgi:hypothetical protein